MGRTFLFATDIADKMRRQIYNVGSDKLNFSKEAVCKLIESQVKCYVHYAEVAEDADKRNYVVSDKKLNSLGYATTISVKQGLSELEVIRKGVDETVGLWRWDRLTAFFRSDQPQVTITQAPVVFLNRFLCIVVLSFSFRPVFFWSGRPGKL